MSAVRPTICHLLHSLHIGGAELLARAYAYAHRGRYRMVFACLDFEGELGTSLIEEGFVVETLSRRPGVDAGCAKRLRDFCYREQVTLIHAHQYAPFSYAALSRGLSRRPRILFHEHGRHWPDYPRRKRILANRFLFGKHDRAVAVGGYVRDALINNEGLPAHRVKVIYNGCDLSQPPNPAQVRAEVRAEWGVADETFVVLQVGRLNYLKDYPTALQTLGRLRACAVDARLIIVGDGELRGELTAMAEAEYATEYVRFLGMRRDVKRLLLGADAFLMSSVSEGIPLALIEALAAGVPAVATRVGGVPEVIVHGESGLLAEAKDAAGLAAHLAAVAGDAALRQRLIEAGRRRAHAQFDEQAMHAALGRVYREMLEEPE